MKWSGLIGICKGDDWTLTDACIADPRQIGGFLEEILMRYDLVDVAVPSSPSLSYLDLLSCISHLYIFAEGQSMR